MSELKGREAVLLDSYMHAREPYSLQLMEGLAQDIVRRGKEGDVGEFLKEGVILFYPFVNPDGYQLYT
jgi:murein tripeptide amidase MpaA